MPYRPKVPCRHPGCPELVESGKLYCAKHLPLHPEVTRSAGKRGYGSRWQRESKQFLQSHPLCVECVKLGRYTKATVVDHIVPHRGDQRLFWDQSNWQSLCKPLEHSKLLFLCYHLLIFVSHKNAKHNLPPDSNLRLKSQNNPTESLFHEIIFDDCVLLIEIIYDVTGVSAPGLCD